MDAVIVGVLTAAAAVSAVLVWQLLVRPDTIVSLWTDGTATEDPWFGSSEGAVRALRVATAALLFLLGVLTGLALTFLQSTG